MYKKENLLSVGDFDFKLVYNDVPPCHRNQARDLHSSALEYYDGTVSNFIPMVPMGHASIHGKVVVHDSTKHGKSGARVDVGVNIDTGDPVLLHLHIWDKEKDEEILGYLEAGLAYARSDHVSGITDTWCSHGHPACVLDRSRRRFPGHHIYSTWRLYERQWPEQEWTDIAYRTKLDYFPSDPHRPLRRPQKRRDPWPNRTNKLGTHTRWATRKWQ